MTTPTKQPTKPSTAPAAAPPLDPTADGIRTVRIIKKFFTGEMTLADVFDGKAPKTQCTKSEQCTEADGHAGGCTFVSPASTP
jgi:hypothetical protein